MAPGARNRRAMTDEGFSVTECALCKSSPVRDDGSEVRGRFNWLVTCDTCSERGCIDCIPDGSTVCVGCGAREADRIPA